MSGLLLAILLTVGAALGIAFFAGAILFNWGALPGTPDWLTPSPAAGTPSPTLAPTVAPTPPRSPPDSAMTAPPVLAPAEAPENAPAPPPPALTPPQIFARLERGEITIQEAIALLGAASPAAGAAPPPTPEAAPPPTPPDAPPQRGSAEWIGQLENQVHDLVNRERRQASLASLSLDHALAQVARGHSRDMALHDFFAHENLSGQSPSDRGRAAGYPCVKDHGTYYTQGIAENILQTSLYSSIYYVNDVPVRKVYMSLEEIAIRVVNGWMGSPGHRQNILDGSYDRQGIGVAVSDDEKVYVTQNFC